MVQITAVGFALSPTFSKGIGTPPIVRNIPRFRLVFCCFRAGSGNKKRC